MPHEDIRIGTLAQANRGASYLKQIIRHGFESFQLTFWQRIDEGLDLGRLAAEVRQTLDAAPDLAHLRAGSKPTISSLAIFGNPLQEEQCAADWGRLIDACESFGCAMVCGFAGRIVDKPIPESMPTYRKVFGELAKRAADRGVRIAFENCDMGGDWQRGAWNIAHAPTAWEMMFNEVPDENVGLEWEPCHQMNSLIDPLPQLREWVAKGRIFHLHGKDATVDWHAVRTKGLRGGTPYVWHRTPGFGDTNWTDVISILRQHGFKGAIDIEGWHDPVYRDELEMTGQVHGLKYLQHCRGGAFVENPK